MNPKYTHDFSSASIKHIIEAEFYQKAGEAIGKCSSATIVTGPDYQRHLDNVKKYIDVPKVRICEINPKIFSTLYIECENLPNVSVVNSSIENFGSMFIDADLTCTSDLVAIRATLLRQIDVLAGSTDKSKAFILSFGLRTTNKPQSITKMLAPIWGLLGARLNSILSKTKMLKELTSAGHYCYRIKFGINKGRIKDYICYTYNAGGGPMLTCLLIYK